MADSNAPEHKDRGLFGLFGKKDEQKHDQQQSHTVDPHAPAYTGQVHNAQPQHYAQGAGVEGYGGEVHHAQPPVVAHEPQRYGQEEGGKKQHEGLMGKLHRSNSSSSSSSSDEDESGGKKEGRKKKRMKEKIKEKLPGHQGEKETKEDPEKKGFMEKIKEKLPGHKEGETGH